MGSYSIELLEKDGFRNARIHHSGRSFTLHSSQPYREAERVVKNFNTGMEWVLIAGFGFGYIIDYILKNTELRIIVFEPDNDIMEAAEKFPDTKKIIADPRVKIIKQDKDLIINFLEENGIKELSFYIHRPYFNLYPDIMSSLEGIISAYLSKKQINKATLKRFQKVWLRNIIKNSSYYFKLPGINDIRHNFTGKPAVIVGAGPSLSKNIDVLKKYQDRVAIISTDTAYINLCNYGILADFVVSVDPQDKNSLYLLYAFNGSSRLVIDSAASFMSFAKFSQGNIFIFDSTLPIYKELKKFWGEKGELLCGGSVSTSAFDLARYLKCDPIIFIGQDLSYPHKQTHIRGSILEELLYYRINRIETYENYNSKMLLLSDRIEIEGWDGKMVSTDRKFLTFLEWFKKEIHETSSSVINSTEGGALIKGAKHLPLIEVLKTLGSSSPLNKEVKAESKPSNESGFLNLLKELKEELIKVEEFSMKAYYASKGALKKFKNNKDSVEEYHTMTEFDTFFLKCAHENSLLARLIEFTMQGSIETISSMTMNGGLTTSTLEAWCSLYEEAFDGFSYILRLIDKRLKAQAAS